MADRLIERTNKAGASLKPRVRYISQEIIRTKWIVLLESTQVMIQELLRSIELPVLAQHNAEPEKIDAQTVISSLKQTFGHPDSFDKNKLTNI